MIKLSEWSTSLSQPASNSVYESAQVLFSTPNTNTPDPSWGVPPTIFDVDTPVIPGNKYIFEILGDGAVGLLTATGYADGGLYLAQNSTTWNKFGNFALRSDITFGSASTVPLPSTVWLLIIGLPLLVWSRKKKVSIVKYYANRGLALRYYLCNSGFN